MEGLDSVKSLSAAEETSYQPEERDRERVGSSSTSRKVVTPTAPVSAPGEVSASDIQKRIVDAFEVFDHEQTKTVDIREIGTIIRSLGFCPSEAELHDVVREMEDPKQLGSIPLERFQPMMTKIINQQKFQSESVELLQEAFQVLDPEGTGQISSEEIRRIFTEQGEPFGSDEIEEMLNAAVDPQTKNISYRSFAHLLVVDDDLN